MPRKKKPKTEEPATVAELLESGLVKPASEIESPVADLAPSDREIIPSGPNRPRGDEPRQLGDVLGRSPAVAAILASREPEPTTSMENVTAEALAESQKPTHVQRLTGLRPAPKGFVGLEGHYNAGIRLTRSLDKRTVAVQFADDWRPSRDGSNPEKQRLDDRGFKYQPDRAQWERFDREQPGENYQDAKEFVAGLVKDRLVERGDEVGRS